MEIGCHLSLTSTTKTSMLCQNLAQLDLDYLDKSDKRNWMSNRRNE